MGLRVPVAASGFRPVSSTAVRYRDGEAWFALAFYNDAFPGDAGVASVLESLDAYLMVRYADEVKTGFYQWGTMAAARRFKATSNEKFLSFIRAQAEAFLKAPRRDQWRGDNSCADIEGLATAARMLRAHAPADGQLLERLQLRLNEEMEQSACRFRPTSAWSSARAPIHSPRLRDFSGAFLEGRFRPPTRVDATAHCVSAMLKLAS
jgi:hypothetical protein